MQTCRFEHLEVQVINEHGHLLTWHGSNPELKPLLLMAHTDVVPVSGSTADAWTYEPFSGHYDGKFVWGRGSEDDKSNVVAILSTIELFLSKDFQPTRTVVMSIGFDEEGGADKSYGARCLAGVVLQKYGKDGVEMIVSRSPLNRSWLISSLQFDEGMPGVEKQFGTEFAFPATSEKGYLDVTIGVDTPGGLSQNPPKHTGSRSISHEHMDMLTA